MQPSRRRELLEKTLLGRHVLGTPGVDFSDWDESKVTRGENGRFGSHGGAGAGVATPDDAQYDVQVPDEVLGKCRSVFGEDFGPDNIARLGGALPGATVRVDMPADAVRIRIYDKGYHCERSFHIRKGGRIDNDELTVDADQRGQGLGTRILSTQVAEARRWGFTRLSTYAIGISGGKYNGYYTWPLLGYNAKVPDTVKESGNLSAQFAAADTLHELLAMPGGAKAWKDHGEPIACSFDLSDNSRSLAILREYATRKGVDVHFDGDPLDDGDHALLEAIWERIAREGWGWLTP